MKASDFDDDERFDSLGEIDLFECLSGDERKYFGKRYDAAIGSQAQCDVLNEVAAIQLKRENVFYECASCQTMDFGQVHEQRPDIPTGQGIAALKDEGWSLMSSRPVMLKKCEAHK